MENIQNVTMETPWLEVRKTAGKVGIRPVVGKNKKELVEMINGILGENEVIEVANNNVNNNEEEVNMENQNNLGVVEQEDENNTGNKPENKKWHEKEGAFPYEAGDIVKIVDGEILIGRYAEVVKPSNKKDALKGYLINPKTGELQNTLVVFDFCNIEKSSKEAAEDAVRENQPRSQQQEEDNQQNEAV